jgi:hypothetical protein
MDKKAKSVKGEESHKGHPGLSKGKENCDAPLKTKRA